MDRFTDTQERLAPSASEFGVSWTGQAGFSFKSPGGEAIHVDPYLSNVCARHVGYHRTATPPVEAEDIRGQHFLFTHDHRDHLDSDAVPVIAANNPGARFYGPPSCISRLLELEIAPERLVTMRRAESLDIGGVRVKAVLALHTLDSVGYVLSFGGIKVYITGDTVYSDDLIAIAEERPELMMCCINGRLGCMNIADAVRLTSHIQPRIAVPMHVRMFQENTASAEEFARQAELHSGITKAVIMAQGAWYMYSRENGLCKTIPNGRGE